MLQKKTHLRPSSSKDYLRLFFTGFAMGAADTVPGVSGGTMAFILGIYKDLIEAIKSFDLQVPVLFFKRRFKELLERVPFPFLVALLAGIGTAIFTLSSLLSELLATQPSYLFAFFGGLILASILSIGAQVSWSGRSVLALLCGTVAAFVVVGLNPPESASHTPLVLFLSGMVAISAMILPGISGSFILLILGQYEFVLNAVRDRELATLFIVALGCMVGIVIASRVLSYLLKRYYVLTIVLLTGFMVGSMRVIWSSFASGMDRMPRFGASQWLLSGALMVGGFLLVSFLDHLATGRNPLFRRLPSGFQKQIPASKATSGE